MLHPFLFWLQQRKLINLVFIFAYFIFILLIHDHIVHVSMWVEKNLSLSVYNAVVAVVFLSLVAALVFFLQKKLRQQSEDRNLHLVYFSITITAIIIHSRFMFDSNIEVIHSLEFTLLALLIFPLTRRFGGTISFVLPFMLFDEWFQYTVLYPQWLDYFDLNDILMDTYGCAMTMIVLMILGVKGNTNVKVFWKRPEFILLISLIVVILIAAKLCFIAAYANEACGNTLLIMNKGMVAEPFFRFHPTHLVWFHVMKPVEGFIAIMLLHLFYFGLDSFRKTGNAKV